MADIEQHLQNLMNARYGKDVRQSIHDSIQAINEQVEAGGSGAGNSITVENGRLIISGNGSTSVEDGRLKL